ncbi:MAG TPA: UDP-3-O-acyl-N-acetylglucosamine deacetylase [Blastocatellia bacterium]|nr:UDP-3-O-acyl-N-acetylglucosamine deacetylase [Blastocatellia bacterium]
MNVHFVHTDIQGRFSLIRQTTLRQAVSTSGCGLHTGEPVRMTLRHATADTGFVIRRTDLNNFEIPAAPEFVARVSYATTLMRQGVMIATVEHLLAALVGSHVDNCMIEIDSLEVPILDGSAEQFIEMVERAGVAELEAPRQFLRVLKRVEVSDGNRRMSISPSSRFSISCLIEFPHPMIGTQRREIELSNGQFTQEVASARTFGFLDEIEALRNSGLIRGGSLENAVVLTPEGGVMNREGLRFADEFVRHKIIDIIGDLALFGMPVLGHVEAERTGHGVHTALVSRVLRDDSAWEITDAPLLSQSAK